MKKNFVCAIGIIVCGAAVLCGMSLVADIAQNNAVLNVSWQRGSQISLLGILSEQEAIVRNDANLLPQGFQAEVFPVDGFYGIHVSQEGGVIGLFSRQAKGELMNYCEKEVLSRGWVKVESGYAGCVSFVKGRGSFTWLFLSFFEVKGEASVLVSIQ